MSEAGAIQFHIEPDVWLPVADLLTMFHPSNSQTRNREELAAIKRHIADEGFTAEMIVVNPWNQKIVSGHGRTQALHELGYTGTVPVVYREYTSEAEHRRALLRWNLARGHQDPEKQAQEFADLLADFDKDGLAADFGMEAAGFDALLAEWGEGEEKGEDPGAQVDRAEELRQVWGVEVGQLWKLGNHRLICGDCTDAAVVERVMGGEKADCVVTDPPYAILGGGTSLAGKGIDAAFDRQFFRAWFKSFFLTLLQFLNKESALWMTIDWRGATAIEEAIAGQSHRLAALGVWDRGGLGMGYILRKTYENFAVIVSDGFSRTQTDEPDVWRSQWTPGDREHGHQAEKPVDIMVRAINLFGAEVVIEPFSGSGTTLIACEQLNRKCRAVEISPAYVAVALQRWADMTGGTPELIP